jgi:hypothetical protein
MILTDLQHYAALKKTLTPRYQLDVSGPLVAERIVSGSVINVVEKCGAE